MKKIIFFCSVSLLLCINAIAQNSFYERAQETIIKLKSDVSKFQTLLPDFERRIVGLWQTTDDAGLHYIYITKSENNLFQFQICSGGPTLDNPENFVIECNSPTSAEVIDSRGKPKLKLSIEGWWTSAILGLSEINNDFSIVENSVFFHTSALIRKDPSLYTIIQK